MKIFTSKPALSEYLNKLKTENKSIGFVPTMGALHEGHLSLIRQARESCDVTVCSIFVNPTQFTDPRDLERYPRTENADKEKLESVHCDVLFLPAVDEMYDAAEYWDLDLGYLETVLEGAHRPGHFRGVTQIVKKLFDVVIPDKAFFGQKDFQQVKVIEKMTEVLNLRVEIVMCPIEREEDGLALSSRNIHLTAEDRKNALALSETLLATRNKFDSASLSELQLNAESFLMQKKGIILDYFAICNGETLLPAQSKEEEPLVALVAAKVGSTRLIDNIIIK